MSRTTPVPRAAFPGAMPTRLADACHEVAAIAALNVRDTPDARPELHSCIASICNLLRDEPLRPDVGADAALALHLAGMLTAWAATSTVAS